MAAVWVGRVEGEKRSQQGRPVVHEAVATVCGGRRTQIAGEGGGREEVLNREAYGTRGGSEEEGGEAATVCDGRRMQFLV